MLTLKKIFRFETAHAIHGFPGNRKNIHRHSYELHVTVTLEKENPDFIPASFFILDSKELEPLVTSVIIKTFEHKHVLLPAYLAHTPAIISSENFVAWGAESIAENMRGI